MQIDSSLRPLPNTPLALNQSILAAYKQMSATYQPKSTNAVIVMTAGVGTAPGDLPTATLVSQLRKLYNPARPVELIIVVLGPKANFTALQQVATAGGGAAYQVASPDQIGRVFFQAVSRRIGGAGRAPLLPDPRDLGSGDAAKNLRRFSANSCEPGGRDARQQL